MWLLIQTMTMVTILLLKNWPNRLQSSRYNLRILKGPTITSGRHGWRTERIIWPLIQMMITIPLPPCPHQSLKGPWQDKNALLKSKPSLNIPWSSPKTSHCKTKKISPKKITLPLTSSGTISQTIIFKKKVTSKQILPYMPSTLNLW